MMSDRQMMGRQQNQYSNMDQQHQRMGMDQMDRHMGMDRQMSNMGMDRRMNSMDRHMSSNMRSNNMMGMDRQMYNNDQQQQQFGIDQYYKRDDFGNYAYGYANGNSEKYEVGNPQGGVKGHYMYVDSNGLNQRVEYIADDQGFRIVGGEDKRFKREAEPSMRMMTSYMDSSLMDDDVMQMERTLARNGMSMNRRMMDMHDMSMPQMRMDDGILGERNTMSQRMEIERIPENNVSFMLF